MEQAHMKPNYHHNAISRLRYVALALIMSAGYFHVAGQTDDSARLDSIAEAMVNLDAVEVYGKSTSQQLREGGLSVNAIDVKSILSSLSSLNGLVNRSSGVKIRQQGGVGSDYDLSINGLSGNSVRYFIDGMPLAIKGADVNLSNLPLNIIERVEVYKGVVPARFGTDALGGAVNIVTSRNRRPYLDASVQAGSFGTYGASVSGQFAIPGTKVIVRPVFDINYARNDYKMKGVELWDDDADDYIITDRKRFHDRYRSILGQIEAGVQDAGWADEFFVVASYNTVFKQIQTSQIQDRVYGKVDRRSYATGIGLRYSKIFGPVSTRLTVNHTWDRSETVDTAQVIYDWNGNYRPASGNEINRRVPSIRVYRRPLTLVNAGADWTVATGHTLSLGYTMDRTGNSRSDKIDGTFEPTSDALTKHVLSLNYAQELLDGRLSSVYFIKNYIHAAHIRQYDHATLTGADKIDPDAVNTYWGGGAAVRYRLYEPLAFKVSYEHSVRLPLTRELLGNGTTIAPNVALRPESSENINAGILGTWHIDRDNTLSYETTGFFRFVKDDIQAEIITTDGNEYGSMRYKNNPAVHIKGIEGEVRYSWRDRLQVTANMSYVDARDQKKFKTDGKPSATYRNRVPNRPWFYANADASYTFRNLLPRMSDRLRLGYSWQWVHWYFLNWEAYGNRASKARIPTQSISNVSLTYGWMDDRYSMSVECSNLFDARVYDNFRLQRPGRAFMAKFRIFIQ